MAGCKFFKAEFYRTCLSIAQNFAYRALIGDWKSVEVVQAFACLTYWKEPDDTRTWTWIGYVRLRFSQWLVTDRPYVTKLRIYPPYAADSILADDDP